MQTCTFFASYSNWLTRELEKADPDLCALTRPPNMHDPEWARLQALRASGPAPSRASPADAERRVGELFDILRKWEGNFSRHLQILLDALNHYAATETVVLLSLCARLSTANQGSEYALRSEE